MKVLVIGAAGLLGQKTVENAVEAGHSVVPFDVVPALETPAGPVLPFDLTDRAVVKEVVGSAGADWIVNAAGYTAVDESEGQREIAWEVNVEGVRNLLEAADRSGTRLCTLSTDYVFDGRAGPYSEDAPKNPLGAYGETKAAMEDVIAESPGRHLIARTMVLYGAAPGVRPNFALWVVRNLLAGERFRVVTDQIGNPTLATDLARLILAMLEQEGNGTYHAAGADRVSRFDFARALARAFELDGDLIEAVTTEELGQRAVRPLESGFILDRIRTDFGLELLGLEDSLAAFRREFERYGGES
jgi:dTDP-4-dehydrorhamnose reductase